MSLNERDYLTDEQVAAKFLEYAQWLENELQREEEKKHQAGWLLILITREGFRMDLHVADRTPPELFYVPRKDDMPAFVQPGEKVTIGIAPRYTFERSGADRQRSIAWYKERR